MSYARFGRDSDVYVFGTTADPGTYQCLDCMLGPETEAAPQVDVDTAAEMIEHLLAHRAAGHKVAESALEELRAEDASGLKFGGF